MLASGGPSQLRNQLIGGPPVLVGRHSWPKGAQLLRSRVRLKKSRTSMARPASRALTAEARGERARGRGQICLFLRCLGGL